MTNGERADRLIGEARQIAGEMKRALDVTPAQARDWVQRVERALHFGEDLLRRLRRAL